MKPDKTVIILNAIKSMTIFYSNRVGFCDSKMLVSNSTNVDNIKT